MRVAFVTMVWRDHWLLEKWIAHHATYIPKSHLHVLNHGADPKIDKIAAGCTVIPVPRDDVTLDLTRRRWDLLGHMASGLLAFYDRVVVLDVDEFLIYRGSAPSLTEHITTTPPDGSAAAAIGLNLLPEPSDNDAEHILTRFPRALVSAKYTKPCVTAKPLRYTLGGHGLVGGDFRVDPALLLCHLHFVTPDYDTRVAARRDIVAQSRSHGADSAHPNATKTQFWRNWSDPDRILAQVRARAARAETMDLDKDAAIIADRLNQAYRRKARRVMIDPAMDDIHPMRVNVPPALRTAF